MKLQGCFPALVTPFTPQGSVDESGLRQNIDRLIANGVAGVVPCGTTGESATLSWQEHNRVVSIAVEQAAGRCKVIAGAGSNNTLESIEAAKHAQESGADAILCITPYYNKPTQLGLIKHYQKIAAGADIPIVVYNVPGRTGVNLLPETLEEIAKIDTVVGVKEASGDLSQVSEIHRRLGDRISILSGDDALTLPIIALGGSGVISVVGNFVSEKMSTMVQLALEGNFAKARELHEQLLTVCNAMFIESNPIPVKAVMAMLGYPAGPVRLPLTDCTDQNKQTLLTVLKEAGVIA